MTLGEMKDTIANRLGDTSTNTGDRIVEFINDIMFRISDDIQYPGERRWGQIRTESGRFAYPLDPDVGSVIEPMIVAESNANIWMTPVETFNANVQNPTSTGVPHNFMMYGNYGVLRQPASALRFTPADVLTEEITVTIQGMVDYRNVSESVTLPASSAATDSVNSYTTVDKISLSAAPNVTIDVRANGTGLDEVRVTQFTTSETEAATSAYGLFNPGSRVSIHSSSASDGTDRTVVFTGYGPLMGSTPIVSEDYVYQELSLTSNGASDVLSTASQRFTTIESISVDAESVGVITVKVDPLEARKAVFIPQKKRSVDVPIVGFYPIPDGKRINYQYYRKLIALTLDGSRPAMDERVHRYIMKWAETATLAWYGESKGVTEVIQISTPSWMQDMRAIRGILGLSANPEVVIGGRALNISRRYGATAMLDPAHYSN
jgi:hypothetical protein